MADETAVGCFEGKGDWMQTFTGLAFYPFGPEPDDIRIEDIAHALSMICRYGGHTKKFYSVAEHSVRVARILPAELRLDGLLHDATEAYLGDMIRPLKRFSQMGAIYKSVEDGLARAIAAKFNIESPEPPAVKQADNVLLATEHRDLMAAAPFPWRGLPEPLPEQIRPWDSTRAEENFLEEFGRAPQGIPVAPNEVTP